MYLNKIIRSYLLVKMQLVTTRDYRGSVLQFERVDSLCNRASRKGDAAFQLLFRGRRQAEHEWEKVGRAETIRRFCHQEIGNMIVRLQELTCSTETNFSEMADKTLKSQEARYNYLNQRAKMV